MYIVAIAWLYVTILMAATEPNIVAGILTFLFYGAAPLGLFLWLTGTGKRRRIKNLREKESNAELTDTEVPPVKE